ncbi:MAG: hypothetical protein LKI24_13760 [Acidipropionibacterium sp.]|nr:hypothetical protein [Acidipropionibacterium sp.]
MTAAGRALRRRTGARTRSTGRFASSPGIVVRGWDRPRTTGCTPSSAHSRSTVQRATRMGSRFNWAWIVRIP